MSNLADFRITSQILADLSYFEFLSVILTSGIIHQSNIMIFAEFFNFP